MMKTFAVAMAAALAWSGVAKTQELRVVRPLDGYACMNLLSPEASPVVLQAPSATAPRVGLASYTMIVASPVVAMNGYVRVLHMSGRHGWLDAKQLRPFHNQSNTARTCEPVVMSNGYPGFRYG